MPDEDADEAAEPLQPSTALTASKATEEDSASAAAALDTTKALLSSRRSKQEQPPAFRALTALCRVILQETQPKLTYAVSPLLVVVRSLFCSCGSCSSLHPHDLALMELPIARSKGELVPAYWDTTQESDQQPGAFAMFLLYADAKFLSSFADEDELDDELSLFEEALFHLYRLRVSADLPCRRCCPPLEPPGTSALLLFIVSLCSLFCLCLLSFSPAVSLLEQRAVLRLVEPYLMSAAP
jgi:hypothetical protein